MAGAGAAEAHATAVLHALDVKAVTQDPEQFLVAVGVGGNCSSVNRVLKRLEEQELLLARYGQILILDKASLDKIAGLG